VLKFNFVPKSMSVSLLQTMFTVSQCQKSVNGLEATGIVFTNLVGHPSPTILVLVLNK